jgi:hypothetical protein
MRLTAKPKTAPSTCKQTILVSSWLIPTKSQTENVKPRK